MYGVFQHYTLPVKVELRKILTTWDLAGGTLLKSPRNTLLLSSSFEEHCNLTSHIMITSEER